MASRANGHITGSCEESCDRLQFCPHGRRPVGGSTSTRRPPSRPLSWVARQQILWSRALQPLLPLDAPRARSSDREASWPLRREPTSVPHARRLVVAQLEDWALQHLEAPAELLVSELVTNAVCHTRGPLRLNLAVCDRRLHCEVEDTKSDGPVRCAVNSWDEGGRGIGLLDMLADDWGSCPTATGKTTWFELAAAAPEAD
ncbi:ATP-binding protein [Streptomyces sp. NPDC059165]|uniref:ATP-binding protein n=1 Tax=Streptomyces sp. NPDC059165 TaxID=3346751 RepID=UPI0036BCEE23